MSETSAVRREQGLGGCLTALTIAALSLAPSVAHVLEAGPRLTVWSPALWRETTVFNGQYELFALIGRPLDVGAVVACALLAYATRADRPKFGLAVTASVLFILALAVWLAWVAPVNSVLASWTPGPIPDGFDGIRWRWESGHMVIAALKLLGFMALSLSVALRGQIRPPNTLN